MGLLLGRRSWKFPGLRFFAPGKEGKCRRCGELRCVFILTA